jgi:hypothetical protein
MKRSFSFLLLLLLPLGTAAMLRGTDKSLQADATMVSSRRFRRSLLILCFLRLEVHYSLHVLAGSLFLPVSSGRKR